MTTRLLLIPRERHARELVEFLDIFKAFLEVGIVEKSSDVVYESQLGVPLCLVGKIIGVRIEK